MSCRTSLLAAVALAAGLAVAPAAAQNAADWPSKPVRILVPGSAGGSSDLVGRIVADGLAKAIGKPFVVVNVVGGGSANASLQMVTSPADGYTLLLQSPAPIATAVLLRSDTQYKVTDFVPVSEIVRSSYTLFANPKVFPAKTLQELVDLVKKGPQKYTFSTSGVGTDSHMVIESFFAKVGVKLTSVPYKSGTEAIQAVLSGSSNFALTATTAGLTHVKAGTLLALATASPERIKELPDVPTIKEMVPSFPGFAFSLGIFVPVGTPQAIVDKLGKEIPAVLKEADAQTRMANASLATVGSTPAEYAARYKQEIVDWSEAIKASGVKLD